MISRFKEIMGTGDSRKKSSYQYGLHWRCRFCVGVFDFQSRCPEKYTEYKEKLDIFKEA